MGSQNVKPQGTPTTEVLGVGAVYYGGDASPENWGVTPPTLLGTATKGGSTFNDGAVFVTRAADADVFQVDGAVSLTEMNPVLSINSLSCAVADLVKFYGGMELTAGTTYDNLTRTVDLSAASQDYIWWIQRDRSGKDFVIRLDNALGNAAVNLSQTTKDGELVFPVDFTAQADPATFDPDDATTYPLQYFREK